MKIPWLLSKNLSLVRVIGYLGALSLFSPCSTAYIIVCACSVTPSLQTLCDLMGCSLLGSFLHGFFSGKNIGVGCYSLLQIFHNQGLNPSLLCFLYWQLDSLPLELPLKLQYFGHLMLRTDSLKKPWCWERLKAGGKGDNRGWEGWMASPTQWI